MWHCLQNAGQALTFTSSLISGGITFCTARGKKKETNFPLII